MSKQQLWNELPHEIRQLTFFCENPRKGKDCGTCGSCKRYKYEDLFDGYERNAPTESEDNDEDKEIKELSIEATFEEKAPAPTSNILA